MINGPLMDHLNVCLLVILSQQFSDKNHIKKKYFSIPDFGNLSNPDIF